MSDVLTRKSLNKEKLRFVISYFKDVHYRILVELNQLFTIAIAKAIFGKGKIAPTQNCTHELKKSFYDAYFRVG